MGSLGVFKRQTVFVALVAALVVAAFASVWVSADLVTQRSIELSSSSASAENVVYSVNFTAVGGADAFVVDFCSNTPIVGQPCTPPAGLSVSAAESSSSGVTDVNDISANAVAVTRVISPGSQVAVDLEGISNPSTAGVMYARIITYGTEQGALDYESENLGAGSVDTGSVAVSITSTVGVTGSVLESLTFCVSGQAIGENCADAQNTPPTLVLGEEVGDVVALSSESVSVGVIHTQISTNAASGAVIRLKSSAVGCGGLMRAGAPGACDIAPALKDDIAPGQARFGVKTATATSTGESASGVLQPVDGSGYNNSTFALNFDDNNDATGVTSTFGDRFLDTAGAPVNNRNMALTFGVSASNDTPAGTYSVDLSLIATGKF